jgi:8-oxo-dGTP pyrophosphatase MutT (NUDIX family)
VTDGEDVERGASLERLSSREVYRNSWMLVREDVVRRGDGSEGIYGVVEKPDFAVVLPRGDGGFWMIEQFRYAVDRRAWEFPQGSSPDAADMESLARLELAEEAGLRAGSLRHLGHLFAAYGYSTQGFDVFLATDLTAGPTAREITEQDMVLRFVTDAEVRAMISRGDIADAPSLAALWLWQLDQA